MQFCTDQECKPRKCFSGKSPWERYTRQSPPSLPDYFFGQKVLYWQPSVKRDKWGARGVEAHCLSKAVHLLRNLHPGCFRVWDEVNEDLLVAADIKPLSILPGVESFLQGQQSEPRRRGKVTNDVLESQCKISVDAAAQVLGPGADLPAPRLQGASSHSEEPGAGARGHPDPVMVRTRACSGARMSPEAAGAGSWMSYEWAERGSRRSLL